MAMATQLTVIGTNFQRAFLSSGHYSTTDLRVMCKIEKHVYKEVGVEVHMIHTLLIISSFTCMHNPQSACQGCALFYFCFSKFSVSFSCLFDMLTDTIHCFILLHSPTPRQLVCYIPPFGSICFLVLVC